MGGKELNEAKALLVLVGQCVGVAIGTATAKGEGNPYNAIGADVAKGARVCAMALDETLRCVLTKAVESGISADAISAFARGVVGGFDTSQKVADDAVPKNDVSSVDISDILDKIMRKG